MKSLLILYLTYLKVMTEKVVIDGVEYDISEFRNPSFIEQVDEYEEMVRAYKRAKISYLLYVKDHDLVGLVNELVNIAGLNYRFMDRVDGLPVFNYPEVDFKPVMLFDGAITKTVKKESRMLYNKYVQLCKRMEPIYEKYRDHEKILIAYTRKRLSFIEKYEVYRLVKDREILESFGGK